MTAAQKAIDRPSGPEKLHPVMGMIGALWANFGNGKTDPQKRRMMVLWEEALSDIPVDLQLEAVCRKARTGQLWPPSSPAEVRKWCEEVQKPMDGMDAAWYRSCMETGVLDVDFCARQIEKHTRALESGHAAYAGWD